MDFLNSHSGLSDFFEDGACYEVSERSAANRYDYTTCSTIYNESEGYVEMVLSAGNNDLTLNLKSLEMGENILVHDLVLDTFGDIGIVKLACSNYYEMKNITLDGEKVTFDVIPTGGDCTEKLSSISITKIS